MSNTLQFVAALAVGVATGTLATTALNSMTPGASAPAVRVEAAKPQARPADAAVVEALRKGGHILYLRHAQRAKTDTVNAFDLYQIAAGDKADEEKYRDASCLSAHGRREAVIIGEVFRLGGVPVGPVLASPVCRARQTAELAFGRVDRFERALLYKTMSNAGNAAEFRGGLKQVLATVPVTPGANTVIAAHGNTLENHADLFAEGAALLAGGVVGETGFYVIRREADGRLVLVHKFRHIGAFATHAITLDAAAH